MVEFLRLVLISAKALKFLPSKEQMEREVDSEAGKLDARLSSAPIEPRKSAPWLSGGDGPVHPSDLLAWKRLSIYSHVGP